MPAPKEPIFVKPGSKYDNIAKSVISGVSKSNSGNATPSSVMGKIMSKGKKE